MEGDAGEGKKNRDVKDAINVAKKDNEFIAIQELEIHAPAGRANPIEEMVGKGKRLLFF